MRCKLISAHAKIRTSVLLEEIYILLYQGSHEILRFLVLKIHCITWIRGNPPDAHIAVFRKIPEDLPGMPRTVKFRNNINSIGFSIGKDFNHIILRQILAGVISIHPMGYVRRALIALRQKFRIVNSMRIIAEMIHKLMIIFNRIPAPVIKRNTHVVKQETEPFVI